MAAELRADIERGTPGGGVGLIPSFFVALRRWMLADESPSVMLADLSLPKVSTVRSRGGSTKIKWNTLAQSFEVRWVGEGAVQEGRIGVFRQQCSYLLQV